METPIPTAFFFGSIGVLVALSSSAGPKNTDLLKKWLNKDPGAKTNSARTKRPKWSKFNSPLVSASLSAHPQRMLVYPWEVYPRQLDCRPRLVRQISNVWTQLGSINTTVLLEFTDSSNLRNPNLLLLKNWRLAFFKFSFAFPYAGKLKKLELIGKVKIRVLFIWLYYTEVIQGIKSCLQFSHEEAPTSDILIRLFEQAINIKTAWNPHESTPSRFDFGTDDLLQTVRLLTNLCCWLPFKSMPSRSSSIACLGSQLQWLKNWCFTALIP
jgi:hypothetical protein